MPTIIQKPTPVRDALLRLLHSAGDAGVTTAELAVRMGRSTVAINAMLHRLQTYGYVRKLTTRNGTSPSQPHELNRWTLPSAKGNT